MRFHKSPSWKIQNKTFNTGQNKTIKTRKCSNILSYENNRNSTYCVGSFLFASLTYSCKFVATSWFKTVQQDIFYNKVINLLTPKLKLTTFKQEIWHPTKPGYLIQHTAWPLVWRINAVELNKACYPQVSANLSKSSSNDQLGLDQSHKISR